jgi:hypothetical protein
MRNQTVVLVIAALSSLVALTAGVVLPVPGASASAAGVMMEVAAVPMNGTLAPGGSLDEQERFGLRYWIELIESPGAPPIRVNDRRVFKSGERIRVHVQATAPGVVTLIQIEDSGSSSILFPGKTVTDNSLKAGVERPLPSERAWFRFDARPGTERLLLLFAKTQSDLDRKFQAKPEMDASVTARLIETAKSSAGSKSLFLESEDDGGLHASNATGAPLILEIVLKHE